LNLHPNSSRVWGVPSDAEPAIVTAMADATYDAILRRLSGGPTVAELPRRPSQAPRRPLQRVLSRRRPLRRLPPPHLRKAPAHAAAKAPHGQRRRPAEPTPSSSVSPEAAEAAARGGKVIKLYRLRGLSDRVCSRTAVRVAVRFARHEVQA